MNLQRKIENDTITYFSEDKRILWMKEILNEKSVDVSIGGELISLTAYEFLDEMLALVSVGLNIVIDMSEVTYIASAYMKALLSVQLAIDKKGKGEFRLTKIPDKILDEFNKTGMSDLLYIE